MDTRITTSAIICFLVGISGAYHVASAAEAPTPAQALTLTPLQPLVEYTTPAKDEFAQCTIRPEKENGATSWVIRNRQGELLRRFADTNGDNVVDQWCYFQNGIEVYRDIDSNFNGKADQYRWFNTAGTRWGIDKNEDGKIDSWRVISPHEVAEQVVLAIKSKDQARFELVLLTTDELNGLGFGKARQDSISQSIADAPAGFSKLIAEQKVITPQTRYIDFGSTRPGTIPAGTNGSTKDVTACDNGAALVQTGDEHEQVFLGTLVAVGDTWKLIDAPSDAQGQNIGFLAQGGPAAAGSTGENAPSDEMQKLMAQLEKLDKDAESLPPDQTAANVESRVSALQRLAEIAPANSRNQWYRQLIDVLSVAIQSGSYPKGEERLTQLQKELEDTKADDDLIAHATFQNMWAQFAIDQRDPKADMQKLQDKWQTDLQAFVGQHPKSSDAAEALLQLGMYQEFMGKNEDAPKWYQQLVANFPNARQTQRAAGALTRLGSLGKPMKLTGKDLQSGATVDIDKYRGKVVLIQYWAMWCEPAKQDMVLLKDFYDKRGGRDFDIVAVCLDDNADAAKEFLTQNRFPWKNIYEKGGLDGRLANEMGVMTLPLMILVDQKGSVTNANVHVAELEGELAKLIKPSAGTANALRSPPTSR